MEAEKGKTQRKRTREVAMGNKGEEGTLNSKESKFTHLENSPLPEDPSDNENESEEGSVGVPL